MLKIRHKRKDCIGCYYCEERDDFFWQMDKVDGKANLLGSKPEKDDFVLMVHDDELQAFQAVADLCPVKVIRIEKLKGSS